ncbi:Glycosyltransferase [Forsythia ovata]|uniref:Glycosyltransferase n=1 Tax=Forsythia ovata TaxID=205694 RepID=A0ABD1RI08_9LAMI
MYVSFGSYAHTSRHEILEIANGLLLSGVNFIWVLRPDIVSSDDSGFLSVGFEESVKGRGRILSWCCQIVVISHPVIRGFLTYCGWNSILESIWCTVPLLCYSLLTDQFTNRKLVVDDLKVGINLCDDKKSVNREEVSENINHLMKAKASSEIREQVKKVKKILEDGMEKSIRGDGGPDGATRENENHKSHQEHKREIARDSNSKNDKNAILKVYNDDEPHSSPIFSARFNQIPESDETEEKNEEFPGFFVNVYVNNNMSPELKLKNVDVVLLPEAMVVSVGRSSKNNTMVLKIKAPPASAKNAKRALIDLVTALNVSSSVTAKKLLMMKRTIRLVVSPLSAADLLLIVAFSIVSKRLRGR